MAAYPQYCVPRDDLVEAWLIDDDRTERLGAGPARRHSLRVRDVVREGAAWVWQDGAPEAVRGTVRFRWDALDEWLEEDEPVHVHPRSPYARVDALRSSSRVRVEIDGVVLADAPHCVKLFETGLPTRYYLDRAHINRPLLRRTDHVTRCPYKGTTTGYWSFDGGTGPHENILWTYGFPTVQVSHRGPGGVLQRVRGPVRGRRPPPRPTGTPGCRRGRAAGGSDTAQVEGCGPGPAGAVVRPGGAAGGRSRPSGPPRRCLRPGGGASAGSRG